MGKNITDCEIEELEKLPQGELNRKLLERIFVLEKQVRKLKIRIGWDETVLIDHQVPGFGG